MTRISPRDVINPIIEARASQIEDPVAKLRFLKSSKRRVDNVERVLARPQYWWIKSRRFWVAFLFLLTVPISTLFRASAPVTPVLSALSRETKVAEAALDKVWLVETKNNVESWSNGLRIETRYLTTHRPREYYVWNRNNPGSGLTQLPEKKAAGIVFHTTEGALEDLAEHKTQRLKLIGESLLQFVQREKAYHYVIDRFGRVFRVVREGDVANHAGRSIWADGRWAYIALNESFLAVSFETQTRAGDEAPIVSQAQIDSGRMLTRMLRSRYDIAAANCVTHAQVSVNTSNFLIGWHTDWAGNFPFEEMGLPDNYAEPQPAIHLFGFGYDPTFFAATGARMWKGVVAAEDSLRETAKRKALSVSQLRTQLRDNYRRLSALLPENTGPEHGEAKSHAQPNDNQSNDNQSKTPEVNP